MSEKPGALYYFTMAMTGIYVLIGFYLLLAPGAAEFLPGWKHWVLGILALLYAGSRFVRLQKIQKSMRAEREE